MFEGMLEVEGTIRPASLWPTGSSDADTSTLVVEAKPGSFRFRESARGRARVTRVFEKATVVGRVRKAAVDEQHRTVVRLQAIDAPELHYRAQGLVAPAERSASQQQAFSEVSADYRQPFGEAATLALRAFLGTPVKGASLDQQIPCLLRTRVDDPSDVFDTYGRMVAEAFVKKAGKWVSLNQWLAKSGWAVPTFYSSMSNEEIETFADLGNHACRAGAGIWRHYRSAVGPFGWLRYRGKGAVVDSHAEAGTVALPKLFRRQCAWSVNRRGRMTRAASFKSYLDSTKDVCFSTDDFLLQGPTAATPRTLDELVHGQGHLTVRPVDLVFHEAPSRLVGLDNEKLGW